MKFRQAFICIISCRVFKPSLDFLPDSLAGDSRRSSARMSFNRVRGSIVSMNHDIEDMMKMGKRKKKLRRKYSARARIVGKTCSVGIDQPVEVTSV